MAKYEEITISEVPYGSRIRVYMTSRGQPVTDARDAALLPDGSRRTVQAYLVGFRCGDDDDGNPEYMIGFDEREGATVDFCYRVQNKDDKLPSKRYTWSREAWDRMTHRYYFDADDSEVLLVKAAHNGCLDEIKHDRSAAHGIFGGDPLAGTVSWQEWRDQGRQPNECACRIPRKDCSYHR